MMGGFVKMKKIIAFMLSWGIIASMIPQTVIAEEEITDITVCDEYKVVNEMGLLSENISEKLSDGESITKGEFASVLYNIIKFTSNSSATSDEPWKDEFFGDYSMDQTAQIITSKGAFDDVDSATEYNNEIKYITSLGLMQVTGSNFEPDKKITYAQMLEEVLKLLGTGALVNAAGGYPDGVMAYGATLNLYTKNANDQMSVNDMCKLLYSAFDKNVTEGYFTQGYLSDGKFTYKESDLTFTEKWMDLTVVKGIMTDDGISALGKESIGNKRVMIGSDVYTAEADCTGLLGYKVKAYISTANDTENTMYAVIKNGQNTVTEIDSADFDKYENRKIYYMSGSSRKNVSLQEKMFLIYNGKDKASWSAKDFDFADGTIKVIKNGGDYDVVIVENYSNIFVSSYDTKNNVIYNKAQDDTLDNGDEMYDLTKAIEEERLFISFKDGSAATVNDIKQGVEIDIILNDDYAKLIISSDSKNDLLIRQIDSNGADSKYRFTVSDGENEYEVSKSFLTALNTVRLESGKSYTAYFNRNGIIVWIESNYIKSEKVAYYIKGYMDDDEQYTMKILTEEGNVVKLVAEERVSYTNAQGQTDKINSEVAKNRLNDYEGVISYKTNDENKVKAIIIPRAKASNDETLHMVYDCGTSTLGCKSGTITSLGNKVFASKSTKIFVIPVSAEAKADDSNYKIGVNSDLFATDQSYSVVAYALNPESRMSDYMVYKKDATNEIKYGTSTLKFILVEDIATTIDADDDETKMITGKLFGYEQSLTNVTYYAKCDQTDSKGNIVSALDIAQDMPRSKNAKGEYNTYKIQKGDIIRVALDADGSTITVAQLVYGIQRDNPEFEGGRKGYLAGTHSNLTEPNDYYTNPFSVNYNNGNLNKVSSWSGGNKVLSAFVYDMIGGVMELTTKDLSVSSYYDNTGITYMTEWRPYSKNTLITVDNKTYTVTSGSESDIRTYKNAGSRCSKVIMVSIDMHERLMIVIND